MSTLSAPILAVLFMVSPAPSGPDRLIAEMGSEQYKIREAATRSLRELGVPALAALRRAAADSDDPEVRHRADWLVRAIQNRVVAEAKASKRGGRDKFERVSKLIEPGMEMEQVRARLGESQELGLEKGQHFEGFADCNVVVGHCGGKVVSVLDWEKAKDRFRPPEAPCAPPPAPMAGPVPPPPQVGPVAPPPVPQKP